MHNFWVTVKHTIRQRLLSKSFLWSTIIMMLLIIGFINADQILSFFSGEENREGGSIVAVVDDTGQDEEIITMLLENKSETVHYHHYNEGDVEDALQEASDGAFDFVLSLSGDSTSLEATFFSDNSDYNMNEIVNQDVQRVKEAVVTKELDLNEEELAMIHAPVSFQIETLTEDGKVQTEESRMQAYWMVYGLVFAIYLIVLSFGTIIATEVATEKSSRVMELIVSSINPIVQMFGKLVGIGIVGVINLLSLFVAGMIGFTLNDTDVFQFFTRGSLDISLLWYALLFIVLGYFVYGGVAAMLGALVSRAEEVNQALQPLIFLAMIAFFIAIFGLNTPDSMMIQVLSYIPFFTPQLLFLRIGMGTVPMWEMVVIIGILVLSAIAINILAARVYKGGVLMYGKFSLKDGIKRALTLAKKES